MSYSATGMYLMEDPLALVVELPKKIIGISFFPKKCVEIRMLDSILSTPCLKNVVSCTHFWLVTSLHLHREHVHVFFTRRPLRRI